MKKLFAVILASIISFSPMAVNSAEISAHFDGITVTLEQEPCENEKVLASIRPEFQEMFQKGTATFEGKTIGLCWAIDPMNPVEVFVVDEDGGFGGIPVQLFTEAAKTRVETPNL